MNVKATAIPLCIRREEKGGLAILFKNLMVITGEWKQTLLGCAP